MATLLHEKLVASCVEPKVFGGCLFVSTHFHYDKESGAGQSLYEDLWSSSVPVKLIVLISLMSCVTPPAQNSIESLERILILTCAACYNDNTLLVFSESAGFVAFDGEMTRLKNAEIQRLPNLWEVPITLAMICQELEQLNLSPPVMLPTLSL
ncbi:unnamed protein product [Brassica oleracea var. botrytis]|uniref:Uncharacterized protein n=1 Tax=Brassica oleracea TaxID=3712 RepID=A0A3P6CHP0_BRAOL|nr:unnamed protein product [Brassica oleracea]